MHVTVFRATACGICLVSFGISPRAAAHDSSSIRQQVRENGRFESMLVRTDKVLQLSELAQQADLVVEATTANARSYLDKSETHIYTDYVFTLRALFKNGRRPTLRTGSTLRVRRESGSIQIDGRSAVALENEFPPFDAREAYVLFLKQWPGENVYEVLGGPQGTFKAGEDVTSVSNGRALARDEFFGELRALLKFTD